LVNSQTPIDESALSWKGELCRKGIHLLSLSIPIGFLIFNSRVVLFCLILSFIISALFDLLRFFGNMTVKSFLGINFGFLLRPREKKSFSGATTILLSGILVYLLFDVSVAAAAMVIIVVGDTFAALVGRYFGRYKFFNKSLEGLVAFILGASIAVYFIPGLPSYAAFIGVIIGAFVEFLPLPIDDNIVVPIVSGGTIQLLINQLVVL
jgi:dolichol kinase